MTVPRVQLSDGHSIPQIGLGTALDDQAIVPVIVNAVEAGFRHIDTAYRYGNQRGVGKGIRDSGIAREELFVTTKLDGEFQGNGRAIAGLDECLRQLGLDYVDLLLIHWPLPQRDEYISTWKTFEKLAEIRCAHAPRVLIIGPVDAPMAHQRGLPRDGSQRAAQ